VTRAVESRGRLALEASAPEGLTGSVELHDRLVLEALGHPDFEDLQIGEIAEGKGVVFFLDIRGFTKLSFVLPNEELLLILLALTAASVRSVVRFGGHVIEFTGDGVMATFGNPRTSDETAALAALRTAAFLMKGVRDEVNPRLQQHGTEPVRTAVGMEFGDLLWSRIGLPGNSQVKPISEATFLAGKLCTARFTKAWEVKVGAELAAWMPDEFKERTRRYEFTMGDRMYSRDLFFFKWEEFGRAYKLQPEKVERRLLGRKLALSAQGSPYLSALQLLAKAGYEAIFDESAECPHLLVKLDVGRGLDAIVTFGSDSADAVPTVFVRQGGRLEVMDVDARQWAQGRADLPALMAAVRRAWS